MPVGIFNVNGDYSDYLRDESRRAGHAEAIAFPCSLNEICEALRIAADRGWSVTVQGGRTGITGGSVPAGGLILNLSRMDGIGVIEDGRITVQSGATLSSIREAIKGSGLFFPADLTETTAAIGGMVANNASGARSFRFGAVRKWIHALEVVLANGEIVRVERGVHKAEGMNFRLGGIHGKLPHLEIPHVKTAAGYFVQPDMDLVDLFIGAEGTLGVVAETTLELLPEPEEVNGLTAFFASEEEALRFVHFLRDTAAESPPTAIEFFDARSLELLRRMKLEDPAFAELPELKPEFHTAIYFEYDGEVPDPVVERAGEAVDCWFVSGGHEIEILKNFRHAVPESVNMLIGRRKQQIPELSKLGTDMSVPDDQLENVMRMYHDGLVETDLEHVIFGHIGNNHLHVNILPRSLAEYEKGMALYLRWAKQVVAMGGSVSAEHGIGKIKTDFLELMYGSDGIAEMRRLKTLFDPDGLLNPGNLFNE